MPMFSWVTLDTEKSISNTYSNPGPLKVYMHAPDGRKWLETKYGGHGFFGGKNYYKLLAEINGLKTVEDGKDLYFGGWVHWKKKQEMRKPMPQEYFIVGSVKDDEKILYPVLSESEQPPRAGGWGRGFEKKNKECLKSGFFYEDVLYENWHWN